MLENEIINYLSNNPPVFADELFSAVSHCCENAEDFSKTLLKLERSGKIVYTKKRKISLPEKLGYVIGTVTASGGKLLFKTDDNTYELDVDRKETVLPGDTVLALPDKKGIKAQFSSIAEKGSRSFVGVVKNGFYGMEFKPDRARLPYAVQIPAKKSGNSRSGDKVRVTVTGRGKNGIYVGEVDKNYGSANNTDANYMAVLDSYGVETEFSDYVLKFAEECVKNTPVSPEGRLDLTAEDIFTIDPPDAKDLDDAVSIKKTEKGYILGVHIADVSAYVPENSCLDEVAFNRGTSIYFTDKVVPMLPEVISNNACSLGENESRNALSVIMEIDFNGEVKNCTIKESIIKSIKKCSYSDINHILSGDADVSLKKAYKKVIPYLETLIELSDILEKRRRSAGAIELETVEAKIILDNTGFPVDIYPYERGKSQEFIEQFMILANESVAQFVYWQNIPFVYRTHDKPDEDRYRTFCALALSLGYVPKGKLNINYAANIQKIVSYFKGTDCERAVSSIALRSMAKAKYSNNCTGHFGLALTHYCHFTSPIRRYPDLVAHRIIKKIINGGVQDRSLDSLRIMTDHAAKKSSENELRTLGAERAIDDMYKALYMTDKIGYAFEGVISSVTGFGFFVELPNTVEGLVRIGDLRDDYYNFSQETLTLKGERQGNTFRIGDTVTVICQSADVSTGQISFTLD